MARHEQLGLKELAQDEIARYSRRALQWLDSVKMGNDAHEAFAALINRLTRRDR